MLRLLLSPKWMAWHVLTLGAMVTCGWLAAWQWGRAGSAMGSALNIGYGLQWPLFALFFGIMWWRFLRMEINDLRAARADAGPAAPEPAPAVVPEQAAVAEQVAAEPVTASVAPAEPAARPSPFTARPAGVTAPPPADPQLRAYNDELARLAARQEEATP
ncbi:MULTISPECIES: hypothetical protein [Pseudonocardia]|uniref:DNA-binding transcriptional regulator of glucitol operon n=2 Tax=Pseudonocardia TaxID=1847 RepID=A0A1Y2MU85_PSEAH|nr:MULTISPECIES: hypothetical protein [Pseudonocardia]OSY38760.1 hypothetical protein BG845_03963 [Pseudonocardia autotrophica]TDN74962.1 DNA-binding transcriptional regulator of glucitol operon [Pseudonocardia autotrophica]BBF98900.1 hypothetical protein Pdca_01100 [Pseudonocardia autotrophica]GEC27820.1 hypothetical protein PSA01_48490 [Pseudonocardia saturnea]